MYIKADGTLQYGHLVVCCSDEFCFESNKNNNDNQTM